MMRSLAPALVLAATALLAVPRAHAVEPSAMAHAAPAGEAGGERSVNAELRVGAGVDTNVAHDPGATQRAALVRVDAAADIEPTPNLRLGFVGWFDERMPHYDQNETSVQLLVMYRRSLTGRLGLKLGSFSEYHRELTTWIEGRILTSGAQLLNDAAEHLSVDLEMPLGPFDVDFGAAGHVKYVWGTDKYGDYGVDGHASVRWVPLSKLAFRVRYQFLFTDLQGFELRDLVGNPSPVHRDLEVLTHQLDFTVRGRPLATLDLFARYEFASISDNYLGYLSGQEHRLIGGVRWDDERRWVLDFAGRMIARAYPLRIPTTIDNQAGAIEFELLADAELWFTRHWGIFARYQFNGESANPFGLIYLQHMVLAGGAVRAGGSW